MVLTAKSVLASGSVPERIWMQAARKGAFVMIVISFRQ
jgi:hypothetical protein